ncbi:hypothetical protein RY27_18780 [Litorilinea aerophila]|nr:hypothetical protein RY27_18780 [Litorilinea aerophila]
MEVYGTKIVLQIVWDWKSDGCTAGFQISCRVPNLDAYRSLIGHLDTINYSSPVRTHFDFFGQPFHRLVRL